MKGRTITADEFQQFGGCGNQLIELLDRDACDMNKTMHHISHAEHFFLAEHREWCRLQIESEWYV